MEGTLFIVGGGLSESADEVFSALIEQAGGPQSRFAFIVTASGSGPDETYRSYRDDFVRLGVPGRPLRAYSAVCRACARRTRV